MVTQHDRPPHNHSRNEIEARVLVGLKERLMAPELVSGFVEGYQGAIRDEQEKAKAAHAQIERRKAEIDRKIAGIFKAIEDGLYEPSMKDRLAELKEQREAVDQEFLAPPPASMEVLLHPAPAKFTVVGSNGWNSPWKVKIN